MARARNIKPSFFTNEVLGTEDPLVGLTFIGLWCLADKDGILEDRPARIKAELFPYREKLDINRYLTVLERTCHVQRYVVDGIGYIKVINFSKHQHPHHTEKPKGFPQPPALDSKCLLTPLSNGYTPSDSLIPDSLIPDSKDNVPRKRGTTYPDDFESFWNEYPGQAKSSKSATYKAWKDQKINGHASEVMSGLEAWKKSDRWGHGFIVDARKFLKERRWEVAVLENETKRDWI